MRLSFKPRDAYAVATIVMYVMAVVGCFLALAGEDGFPAVMVCALMMAVAREGIDGKL
jgi:hypothetical protein